MEVLVNGEDLKNIFIQLTSTQSNNNNKRNDGLWNVTVNKELPNISTPVYVVRPDYKGFSKLFLT